MDGLEERKQVFVMGATNRPGNYCLGRGMQVVGRYLLCLSCELWYYNDCDLQVLFKYLQSVFNIAYLAY